ncbi:RNA polymerase factor sigma-54 [Aureimonas sp. ME7]|uniref:RNA polymerase factor sigma-54 n=1 Tax=Aureimonas sp. ME7 TaxID=2744252 RepID=UPI0015F66E7C|nr:RNA polymerase factor sigma-54 [Aureimonas sp. ME7]
MNLAINLQIRQSQSLAMTPQLLQSIRLLQFHHIELLAFLSREAEGNPLLELVEPGIGASEIAATEGPSPLAPAGDPAPLSGREASDEAFADGAPGEGDPFSAFEAGWDGAPTLAGFAQETPIGERTAGAEVSLHAHAAGEIRDAFARPDERRLAEAWFGDLDPAGYLAGDAALPAEALPLLARLQDLAEPAGLFARHLSECLAIQLRRRDRLDPAMEALMANLPLLARRDFASLSRLTGESEAELLDMLDEIRKLDPRPGARFADGPVGIVVPDVVVRSDPASVGGWRVELNPDAFPRLRIRDRISGLGEEREARVFLAQCRQSATWLQRSLESRARTILKVAGEIVRRQEAFLARGAGHLRPMTLMDVAEAVGMHESTVSRVTAGKFIATPRGTIEMKAFFSAAIAASDGGETHSAESVKLRIQRMVITETVDAVLSDDEIAERLKGEGVELARRTVAKYREALGIASSVQRRREMKARRLAG